MIKVRAFHDDMRASTAIVILNEVEGTLTEGPSRKAMQFDRGAPTWSDVAYGTEVPVAYQLDDEHAEQIMKELVKIFAPELLLDTSAQREDYLHERDRTDKLLDVVADVLASLIDR